MAVQHSYGKIVTDGLVLSLDASDRNSYVSGSTTWNDLAGTNNGTLTNGPTFSSAGNASSIVFDGTNDFVGLGNILNLTTNLSISAWCNISNLTGSQNIFAKPSQYWLHKELDTNKFRFKIEAFTRYEVEANLPLSTSTWYNLVGTYDRSTMKIYINGNFYNSTSISVTIQTTVSSLNVGGWSNGADPFNGNIAIAQIYNRALSDQEILQNYNAQKSRFGLT